MPEPLLDLGNIGIVIQRIGGGGGAQCMGTDLEAQSEGIAAHKFVDAIGGVILVLVGRILLALVPYAKCRRPQFLGICNSGTGSFDKPNATNP